MACDVGDAWREAWERPADPRAQRDARLKEAACASAACVADPFRLAQVFLNLFANALEACPDLLMVRVAVAEAALSGRPTLRVSFRDTGPGFPPEHKARLFEPFHTTKPTGTGLGMAICRRIAEAHGGTIEAGEAEPGAEGVVTLPRAPAARLRLPPAPDLHPILDWGPRPAPPRPVPGRLSAGLRSDRIPR